MASKFNRAQPAFKASTTQARKAKPAAKAKPVIIDVLDAEIPAEQDTAFERMQGTIHGAYEQFFSSTGMCSRRQVVIANVLSFITACAAGYVGAWFATIVASAVLIATGSGFLGFMVWVLAAILTFYATFALGNAVFNAATAYRSGMATHVASAAAARVRGWFGSKRGDLSAA